jgi:hypothetical protein
MWRAPPLRAFPGDIKRSSSAEDVLANRLICRHGACSSSPVLKLIPAALAFVLCLISRLALAQTANTWRDSTDYLAPAAPSPFATGVNVEPQKPESKAPSGEAQRAWYGGQLLISDAASLSLLATGIALSYSGEEIAPGFLWAGALSYALVPTTIHVLHERPAIAVASASLRVALPGLGLVMGAMIECPFSVDGGGGEKCESGPGPVLGPRLGSCWLH